MHFFEKEGVYRDRCSAGRRLAEELESYRGRNPVVLGIPRGGVPVAEEVVQHLDAEGDVILTKKLGAPGNPELALGAVGETGHTVRNEEVIERAQISEEYIEEERQTKWDQIHRRARRYREIRPRVSLADRTVILVDDGIATGATVRACLDMIREEGAREVILAVPVAPSDSLESLRERADEIICPYPVEEGFGGIGLYYRDFGQTQDEDVEKILRRWSE